MNRIFLVALVVMLALLVSSCGGGSSPISPAPIPPGEERVTPAELEGTVLMSAFTVGEAPSRLAVNGGFVYTVNALSNTMSVHSADDYSLARTVSFPVGAGPFDIVFSGDTGFISSSGSNAVYRYQAGSDELDGETVELGTEATADYMFLGPGEMAVVGGKLFVPLSGIESFGNASEGIETVYGTGRVAAIDIESFSLDEFIELEYVNPTVCADGGEGILYIVATGESQFDENFSPYAGSDGALIAYDTASQSIVYTLDLSATLPSAFILVNAYTAYIGSNLRAEVYRVRLDTGVLMRGADDPIRLTNEFSFTSSFAGLPGLGVLAGSFNTDEVYFIDSLDDTVSKYPFTSPFSFKESDTFFGGVQDIAYYAEGDDRKVFVLLGVANRAGVIDFSDIWTRIRLGDEQ